MRIPNGTATVNMEILRDMVKTSHWETEKAVQRLRIYESGDLRKFCVAHAADLFYVIALCEIAQEYGCVRSISLAF